MTVHRPTTRPAERLRVRPQHRDTNEKEVNQQVWQPKCNSRFYLQRNRMAARTFRKKKQQLSLVFFDVIFYVYTHVDNRVIENKRDKCCRKKNMKLQSGGETIGPFMPGKIRRVLNRTRTGPFIRACLILVFFILKLTFKV